MIKKIRLIFLKMRFLSVIKTVPAAALFLLACACEKETGDNGTSQGSSEQLSSIKVSVTDAGFASADGAESGRYAMEFRSGDRIGMFAVRDGLLLASDLCYEFDGNAWTCLSEVNGGFYADAAYYAYYPYAEEHDWNVAPADGASAEGFFSELISGWTPAADQSEESAFRSSRLMVGMVDGTSGNRVDFSMNAATALAVVELPKTYYAFINTDIEVPDYVMSTWSDATFDGDALPFCDDNSRFLYVTGASASTDFSVSYKTDEGESDSWSGTVTSAEAGVYAAEKIDGGENVTEHLLQPGDFYLADGSLLSKDTPSSEVSAADVIGVVCQINPERFDPMLSDVLGDVHALVLATRSPRQPAAQEGRETDLFSWFNSGGSSVSSRDEAAIGFKNIEGYSYEATFNMADADICGYRYNDLIRTRRADDLAAGMYPAFASALDFAERAGGPLQSAPVNSGWYLPSNGEWFDILRSLAGADLAINEKWDPETRSMVSWKDQGAVVSSLNGVMTKVAASQKDLFEEGQAWWTSSTAGTGSSRTVSFNDLGFIHSHWQYKDYSYKVRLVLAF